MYILFHYMRKNIIKHLSCHYLTGTNYTKILLKLFLFGLAQNFKLYDKAISIYYPLPCVAFQFSSFFSRIISLFFITIVIVLYFYSGNTYISYFRFTRITFSLLFCQYCISLLLFHEIPKIFY